jgi:hypothetical protein
MITAGTEEKMHEKQVQGMVSAELRSRKTHRWELPFRTRDSTKSFNLAPPGGAGGYEKVQQAAQGLNAISGDSEFAFVSQR